MSHDYKFKFDQLQDNKSALDDAAYITQGQVRNICFVWADGRMKFLNYAYLVTGEYDPASGTIKLVFTTDEVTIKGTRLEKLYNDLFYQTTKKVQVVDTRYVALADDEAVISEIILK